MVQLRYPPEFVQEGQNGVLDQYVVLVKQFRGGPDFRCQPLLPECFVPVHAVRIIFIEVDSVRIEQEPRFYRATARELCLFRSPVFRVLSTHCGKVSDAFEETIIYVIVALAHAPGADEF